MKFWDILFFSLPFALTTMIAVKDFVSAVKISLLKGLLFSIIITIVFVSLLFLGEWLGRSLCFGFHEVDRLVAVGLIAVVVARWAFSLFSKSKPMLADLSGIGVQIGLAFALGINVLIVSIGLGFAYPMPMSFVVQALVFGLLTLVASYFGVMYGRQGVALSRTRWMLIAILFGVILAFRFL